MLEIEREKPTPKAGKRPKKRYKIEYRVKPERVPELKGSFLWSGLFSKRTNWRLYKAYRTEKARDEALMKYQRRPEKWHQNFEYRKEPDHRVGGHPLD